jgi:hypothetical protein
LRRIDVSAACDVLLQNVVLDRAPDFVERNVLLPRDREVEREQDRGRRVNGHRRRDFVERNAGEQMFHVFERIDRHADFADFAA